MLERNKTSKDAFQSQENKLGDASFFDIPRRQSPSAISHPHSVADHQHARLSLPMNGALTPPTFNLNRQTTRSDTLPPSNDKDITPIVSPAQIRELLINNAENTLVLDLRVYQQFATSRVQGALNLCIPTTLLKRPAYNVQRLADTFSSDYDREIFAGWEQCSHIVVYDANSNLAKEAVTPLNVLKKFTTEGWSGTGLVIKGGFLAFSKLVPELIDSGPVHTGKGASAQPLSISSSGKDTLAVAGGCAMPAEKSAANPFFSNIRQNTDLLDGVGQMPIKKPNDMSQSAERHLPKWLQQASAKNDEGKAVSEKFLKIEKHEQKRMQEALNVQVSYGTPRPDRGRQIQVAGIEKGSKNRYNNIFPYDHTRVKLQNVPQGSCDYINANHVKAQFSNRHYIATQAPIPATFNDFWRVVWEQDVRVVVMLTAESEGGQVKSHNYWTPGEYGPFKLKELSERQVSLEPKKVANKAPQPSANSRPSLGPRRSTTANTPTTQGPSDVKSPASRPSNITVRHLALSHSGHPFQPMHEITQIQYADWPDFGAPASPLDLLGLVEQVNKYIRASSPSERSSTELAPEGQRPVLVHCSAGCGRTGTFCTIDSVIDMLKRQKISRSDHGNDRMEVDGGDDWVSRDDVDLVAKTVDDFRHQRLSMVQNLRQFVLCYESVLQWLVAQEGANPSEKQKRPGIQDSRRSYHG
jgi:protein tyrosine phosphatase